MASTDVKQDNKKPRCSGKSVAVVGGGVSGLAAAYKLKAHGLNVTLFEAERRVGGKLKSVSQDGLIWDEGANTMTETEADVRNLLDNLGLREKQQYKWALFTSIIGNMSSLGQVVIMAACSKVNLPISQNKRYIVKNGKPELIPTDPFALMKSSFLSTKSKFQIFLEPLLWRSSAKKSISSKVSDENLPNSVGDFFERHFGKEVVDYVIDPLVAGRNGGDPDSLSMPYTFPELWNLEKTFGSLIVGAVRLTLERQKNEENKVSSEERKRRLESFSFVGGMQTLCNMICKKLGDDVKLSSKVLSLSYNHDGNSMDDNWSLSYINQQKQRSADQSFDAVIMSSPLDSVKEMKITRRGIPFMLDFLPEYIGGIWSDFDTVPRTYGNNCWRGSGVADILIGKLDTSGGQIMLQRKHPACIKPKVTYVPLSAVITTFKKENVKRPLEGFGVLVPSKEQEENGLKTLGTLFSSMMFPDRAPSDVYLYTTFVGGTRNKDLAKAPLNELKDVVASDLRKLLGAEGEPAFVNHYYWSKAFPLYGHDYNKVLEAIEKMEKCLPGFFYAGNHRGGLSVGQVIASGCKAADLAVTYLNAVDDKASSGK